MAKLEIARKETVFVPGITMSVIEAIRERRAVRQYKQQPVSRDVIKSLLSAAVLAPTALHEEPWAFVIVQDVDLLKQISDAAKETIPSETRDRLSVQFQDPNFNIFYNAQTLIVICGKPTSRFVTADCWLAAENLMLMACSIGLGSCVIGLAMEILNTPEWKKKLGIPDEMTVYAPLILGVPEGKVPVIPRKPPEILTWH